ncbi:MAG: sigma-54-dependent transcriptional regulator, partial [Candidatus Methylomirabilales bacterium]
MPAKRILIVDDEESIRFTLKKALEGEGYGVILAKDGEEGVRMALEASVDLALLDVRLPRLDGLAALTKIKERRPSLPVIMMTAYGTLPIAIEAMKRGAYDYITKPFDVEELSLLVGRAFEVQALVEEVSRLRENLQGQFDFGGVVGQSQGMQEVFKLIGKVAGSDVTVLLLGESGTGKELIARAIHYHSRRFGRPFVAVNCAAIPKELLESELFGHEKGAFTGATALKRGKFELAEGGTIFLDEVGDMDLSLQAIILRVLQEHEIERVGGEGPIPVDVRIIAASNQDLKAAVERKAFREDLFYRLNVMTITLPPLRERKEDIPLLVDHFLKQYAKGQGEEPKIFSREAMELLYQYDWPGNVRELA